MLTFICDDLITVHETYLSERENQGKLMLLLSYKSRTLPEYSGKHILSGENVIFSWNKSVLFRKSITDVSLNHLLLIIDSNNFKLSSIRFYKKKDKVRKTCIYYNANNIMEKQRNNIHITSFRYRREKCQYMHIKLNSNFISSTIDKSLDNLMVTQMQRLTLIKCLKIFLPSIFYTYSPKDYYGP